MEIIIEQIDIDKVKLTIISSNGIGTVVVLDKMQGYSLYSKLRELYKDLD